MTLLGGRLLSEDPHAPALRRWLETLTLTIAAPVLGFLVNRSDPYWVHGAFPWLVLIPLVIGAEHGRRAGLISALILGAGAGYHAQRAESLGLELISWSAGLLLVGVLAGQFRDAARRRRWLLDERANGLAEQLERAQRARTSLQLSHDRIEETLGARSFSLDSALDDASRRMSQLSTPAELSKVALDVLASQAIVRAASLYRVEANDTLGANPVASLGTAATTTASEPHWLVQRAFSSKRMAAIVDAQTHGARDLQDQRVLVAIPLVTATSRLVGVLAVHRMSFMAFQSEQLRNLLVLTGQLADLMEDRLKAIELSRRIAQLEHTQRNSGVVHKRLAPPPPLGASFNRLAAKGSKLAKVQPAARQREQLKRFPPRAS